MINVRSLVVASLIAFAGAGCSYEQICALFHNDEKPAARTATAALTIDGMTCESCAEKLTAAFREAEGVTDARVSFTDKRATVTYDADKSNVAVLTSVVEKTGYRVAGGGETTVAASEGVDAEPGFAMCAMACGTKREYAEKDVVTQPGAKVGDLVRCPVSNAVFDVKEDSPFIEQDGKRFFTCCAGCFAQFQRDPARFFAKVERQNAEHSRRLQ
ncbi:MAG: heavy metal-associated domain-containing protein [Myxococcota bacterium]